MTAVRPLARPAILTLAGVAGAALLAACGTTSTTTSAAGTSTPSAPSVQSAPAPSASAPGPRTTARTTVRTVKSAGTGNAAGTEQAAGSDKAPKRAVLTVRLTATPATGTEQAGYPVALGVRATGAVPQEAGSGGTLLSPAETQLLGTAVNWGDGTSPRDGSDAGDHTCTAGAPLVALTQNLRYAHSYSKPGTYTITFRTEACAPIGTVTRTAVVVVGAQRS